MVSLLSCKASSRSVGQQAVFTLAQLDFLTGITPGEMLFLLYIFCCPHKADLQLQGNTVFFTYIQNYKKQKGGKNPSKKTTNRTVFAQLKKGTESYSLALEKRAAFYGKGGAGPVGVCGRGFGRQTETNMHQQTVSTALLFHGGGGGGGGQGGQFSGGPLLGLGSGTLGSWNRALDILCREDSRPTACLSAIVEKTIQ